MSYRTLRSLFHDPSEDEAAIYDSRFSDPRTIHLETAIKGFPAFIFMTPEIYENLIEASRLDKEILKLELALPERALTNYRNSCLIDEIVITNEIEGVNSTRREIGQVLERLEKNDRRGRFLGIVQKYALLQTRPDIPLETCGDVRTLYDDLVLDEVRQANPDDVPDGQYFRSKIAHVVDQAGIPIHDGLEPEGRIIEEMERALALLGDDTIEPLVRIAAFHFLFEYIHPFYDGNGRMSRFISSYYITKYFEPLAGLGVSYAIKENIKKYYKGFSICEHDLNRGDLTPFVIAFTDIIVQAMRNLRDSLAERKEALKGTLAFIGECIPEKSQHVAEILATASLFTFDGVDTDRLTHEEGVTRQTLSKRLKPLREKGLVTTTKIGRQAFHKLDLDRLETLCTQKEVG